MQEIEIMARIQGQVDDLQDRAVVLKKINEFIKLMDGVKMTYETDEEVVNHFINNYQIMQKVKKTL